MPRETNDFKISAIIPTHNRAAWLDKALQSIFSQTRPALEIIVVDDGSTDGTAGLVAEYSGVQYFKQENRGVSAARNFGVSKSRGNWLAFLDSDDHWAPQKLERQVAFLQANAKLQAVYTNEIWIRNGKRVNQKKKHGKYGGRIYLECLPLCIISPSSILLSKKLWNEIGGFDEALLAAEDYDLWLRISAEHEIGFLDEPLIYKYGGHEDQLSSQWGIDEYRVSALEKMLDRNLPADYRLATLEWVVRRCGILAIGFEKNHKNLEAKKYRDKQKFWQAALLKESDSLA